jgi:hypothetical protein
MSWNESRVRTLRMIFVAGLLLALLCAMLGSIATSGQPWAHTDTAGTPATSPQPASGMTTYGKLYTSEPQVAR